MGIIKKILSILLDIDRYVLYEYDSVRQGDGKKDSNIVVYNTFDDIPDKFVKILFRGVLSFNMKNRLKNKDTYILCYVLNDELISYGWIQSPVFFKAKFGWLGENMSMFGPYWTSPNSRGKGIYGKMLSASIASNIFDKAIIFTHPNNISSQKGIEKAGFKYLGVFKITILFLKFRIVQSI